MNKNNLTKKQLEILTLLYRFRFLNRSQIQKLLNHKKISRINIWLKDLADKKTNKKSKTINKKKEPKRFIPDETKD